MNNSELWIQCWNIYGVFKNINGFTYNKLQDPDFTKQINKCKILGLIETQHAAEDIDQLQINGFKYHQVCRKKKIVKGVSKISTQGSECVILKLREVFQK